MDTLYERLATREKVARQLRKFVESNIFRPAFNEFLKKQLKMKPVKNIKFKNIDSLNIIDPKKEA